MKHLIQNDPATGERIGILEVSREDYECQVSDYGANDESILPPGQHNFRRRRGAADSGLDSAAAPVQTIVHTTIPIDLRVLQYFENLHGEEFKLAIADVLREAVDDNEQTGQAA